MIALARRRSASSTTRVSAILEIPSLMPRAALAGEASPPDPLSLRGEGEPLRAAVHYDEHVHPLWYRAQHSMAYQPAPGQPHGTKG